MIPARIYLAVIVTGILLGVLAAPYWVVPS